MKTLIILFVLVSNFSFASEITFDKLLASVEKNHPTILKELTKFEESKFDVKRRQGAFDLNLRSKIMQREGDVYDGEYFNVRLDKPLPFMNANVFTQYRKGIRKFPSYEDEYETLDDGEVSLGLRMSLLRYRDIDKNRLELNNAKIEQNIASFQVDVVKEQLKYYVLKTYLGWIYSYEEVKIYEKLLEYSIKQDEAIKFRVKRGDLSAIYITENKQYLIKRKSQLEKAKQKYYSMQFYMSLLWRDDDGKIIDIKGPPTDKVFEGIYAKNMDDYKLKLSEVVPVKILKLKINKIKNKFMEAENKLMPKLDLEVSTSKDNGETLTGLDGPEQKILLSVEVPIERNLGKGITQKYSAQRSQLEYKLQYFKEKLESKNIMLKNGLNSTKIIVENSKEELTLAKKMQEAERIRFKNGGSDFFLVNIREQNYAKAQIGLLKAKYQYIDLYSKLMLLKKGVMDEFAI